MQSRVTSRLQALPIYNLDLPKVDMLKLLQATSHHKTTCTTLQRGAVLCVAVLSLTRCFSSVSCLSPQGPHCGVECLSTSAMSTSVVLGLLHYRRLAGLRLCIIKVRPKGHARQRYTSRCHCCHITGFAVWAPCSEPSAGNPRVPFHFIQSCQSRSLA